VRWTYQNATFNYRSRTEKETFKRTPKEHSSLGGGKKARVGDVLEHKAPGRQEAIPEKSHKKRGWVECIVNQNEQDARGEENAHLLRGEKASPWRKGPGSSVMKWERSANQLKEGRARKTARAKKTR